MVPVSLHLSNFLSYGNSSTALDFSQFHTACLSGNNGNGKSALLDGITWALWGEARHTTPALLRLGATEMRVEFAFDLGGERYRIVRGHTKNKRSGAGTLELHILEPESGLFRPLTRSSMRETQAQLDALLRMDYPTFIASAYLKQGQADRFTRQPPAQRKQILAEILGLSRYQDIADRARADARLMDARVQAQDAQIEGIERFLAGRGEAQRLFDFYTASLVKLKPLVETLQTGIDERNARKVRLEEKRKRAENISAEIAAEERKKQELHSARTRFVAQKSEIQEWKQQGEVIVAEFEAFRTAKATLEKWDAIAESYYRLGEDYRRLKEKVQAAAEVLQRRRNELETRIAHEERVVAENTLQVARAAEIGEGAKQLEQARQIESEWVQKRAANDGLQDQLREAENAIRLQRNRLEVELHKIESQLQEAQKLAARLDEAKAALEKSEAPLKELEEANTRLQELQAERNEHDARLGQLKQNVGHEKAQIAANEQKLKVLLANPQAQCPLCESQLGEHGREHIQENIEDEIAQARGRIDEYTGEGRMLQKKKAALDAPIAELQNLLRAAPRLNNLAAEARLRFGEAEAATHRAVDLSIERARYAGELANGDFAPEETKALLQVQTAIQEVGYEPARHAEASAQVAQFTTFEREIAALQFAEQQIEQANARLAELKPQLEQTTAELEKGDYAREDNAELARLKAEADQLQYDKEARTRHAGAKAEFARLENAPRRYDRWKDITAREGEVDAELQRNETANTELEERLAQLKKEQASLADVALQIAELDRTLRESQTELGELRQTEREANAELGRQQGILEACAQREDERVRLDEERKEAAREAFILKQTATAFGKDGIQALIIENAIPELQDEANAILRRLSRNHMQISIESLREKATGGVRETLDIKISDDRGTREYLMYSGGEAFRADFALRIALSKLLARRAGAQLRTLIIDEGFGTQDANGLEQMIDCIQTISEDFSKVLVVTHLEVIKNAFPTRIEVSKEPDTGSHFEVLLG